MIKLQESMTAVKEEMSALNASVGEEVAQKAEERLGRTEQTTWKAMHHPEWVAHPEEEAFISSGEYWTYPYKKNHHKVLTGIRVGDKFCIEAKTAVGKRGGPLKRNRTLGYMRRGTVTSLPMIAGQDFDEKVWYVIKIEWDDTRSQLIDCNNCQQAIVKV